MTRCRSVIEALHPSYSTENSNVASATGKRNTDQDRLTFQVSWGLVEALHRHLNIEALAEPT